MTRSFTLQQIAAQLGGEVSGNAEAGISRVGSLAHANKGAISFFTDAKYLSQLQNTAASAVIVRQEHASLTALPKIITENPYAYFAKVSALLNPATQAEQGVHPAAVVHPEATVPANCSVAAGVVIAAGVVLGENVRIGAGCVLEHGVQVGDGTWLEAKVTIQHDCIIGARCHLFSGSVIGCDGFGYAPESGGWVKIPHVGRVVIGDDVDVGANTTIDRGALDDTVIENGVKLDNLIHIAHNCRIGANTVIAGCVGIAGSAIIGKQCRIGGAAMILGHLEIADGTTISPGSMIMRSIHESGTYTAIMPSQSHEKWLKTAANIRQLNQLADKIKTLEASVKALQNQSKEN
jgi:UDP-3-O-[3-hydroxymyristoyl] glucosamine N-acyltransferase